jgi:alkanesulfonate monooxygenase SsuD/methylene tetrahydromethanopterin reductase-like flavin-dependent oxidoreductase (luciferase family)
VSIYLGALGPRNQQLTAEVADGWTPTPYSPDHDLGAPLRGRLAENGRVVATAPTVPVAVGDNLEALRRLERGWSALYLGGMGGFYAAAATAMGFGPMVETVRERYAGDRSAAKSAVTDEYIDAIGLFGPAERIRDRAARYAGVDELVLELRKPDLADQLQDLKLLREVLR